MESIRNPVVAGQFYPGSASELRSCVEEMLAAVRCEPGPAPKAVIVPHAGYAYSGPVAASAYARLRHHRQRYAHVVLLGPSHHVALTGLAVSGATAFRTPLGDVPLDREAIDAISSPHVLRLDDGHRYEHSIEVHLPFLQVAIGSFSLVPLVVGEASVAAVADVLDGLWDGAETLIVISSDLSHYLHYRQANARDRATCTAIEALAEHRIGSSDACGAAPLRGLLAAARRRGMHVDTLDLRNSGDTAGSRDQVVGYGAWSLYEAKDPLSC
jgi:AmmeMemoRadiSam system protein B